MTFVCCARVVGPLPLVWRGRRALHLSTLSISRLFLFDRAIWRVSNNQIWASKSDAVEIAVHLFRERLDFNLQLLLNREESLLVFVGDEVHSES